MFGVLFFNVGVCDMPNSNQSNPKKIPIAPSLTAALIQLAAFLFLIILAYGVSFIANQYFNATFVLPFFSLFLIQSLLAVTFSYLLRIPKWWLWIHFFFPLAVFLMLKWNVPNHIYLLGFLVFLSLFWTTFRTQVPFYPSRPIVWEKVLNLLSQKQGGALRIVEIGSGLGDMSMYVARMRPDARVEGVEIAPLPWVISFFRAKLRQSSAVFSLGNYQHLDFANYDLIFAYLSPAAMLDLWRKSKSEMKKGSLLVSYEFDIPDVTPAQVIFTGENKPKLYVWNMPGH